MNRRTWRRALGAMRAEAEGIPVKVAPSGLSDLSGMTDADLESLITFLEAGEVDIPAALVSSLGGIADQTLSVLRLMLQVTDPLAPMDQGKWARAILEPAPEVTRYSWAPTHSRFNPAPFLKAVGAPPVKTGEEPFIAAMDARPEWLQDYAAPLRRLLLRLEFRDAQHEDRTYNRPMDRTIRAMIQLADKAEAPERLSWWVEHLTRGTRMGLEDARAWLESWASSGAVMT